MNKFKFFLVVLGISVANVWAVFFSPVKIGEEVSLVATIVVATGVSLALIFTAYMLSCAYRDREQRRGRKDY
ncbi:hypothetical protein IPM19_00610 [bacterium]|nr:MAG: hypothetical protein IPM19_00610 [bacterium]